MRFNRSDLVYPYSWQHTSSDNPKLRGEPDHSEFNRTEGYEVLYMINKIMESRGTFSLTDGKKIERMLKEHPSNLRSQLHVKEWINSNWHRF